MFSSSNDEYIRLAGKLGSLQRNGDSLTVSKEFSLFLETKKQQLNEESSVADGDTMRLMYVSNSGRKAFNIYLSALLSSSQRALAALTLQHIDPSTICTDTIHILLRDSFYRFDIYGAEKLIDRFYRSLHVKPNTRTLNTILEGFRRCMIRDDETFEEKSSVWKNKNEVGVGGIDRRKIYNYYKLFSEEFEVVPDVWTYSSLIRLAQTREEILDIIQRVSLNHGHGESTLSPILVRCAVESLGKVGSPTDALAIALQYLRGSDSCHFNQDSGDSLIVALLHNSSAIINESLANITTAIFRNYEMMEMEMAMGIARRHPSPSVLSSLLLANRTNITTSSHISKTLLPSHAPCTSGDIALNLILTRIITDASLNDCKGDTGTAVAKHILRTNVSSDPSPSLISCSTKGFCLLFSHLQRRTLSSLTYSQFRAQYYKRDTNLDLNSEFLNENGSTNNLTSFSSPYQICDQNLTQIQVVRDSLWSIVAQYLQFQSSNNNSASSTTTYSHRLKLNGRLCDSIIRCHMDNVVAAKRFWRLEIFPFAQQLESKRPGSLVEIAEKSMEALIYVSSLNSRVDMALEIALTARKRQWSYDARKKLAESYMIGKTQRPSLFPSKTGMGIGFLGLNNMVTDSLERSIEAELGLQLIDPDGQEPMNSKSLKRIRIQFSPPPSFLK